MKVRSQGFRGMGREIAGRVFRGRIPLNPAVWSRIKYAITRGCCLFLPDCVLRRVAFYRALKLR